MCNLMICSYLTAVLAARDGSTVVFSQRLRNSPTVNFVVSGIPVACAFTNLAWTSCFVAP